MSDTAENDATTGEREWFESGDGHGYVYQYVGPIHYLCECGDYFLNRERWLAHKAEQAHDCREGCTGSQPSLDRWSERTGHW